MNKTSFCIVIGRMHSSTTPIEEKRPIAAGCDVQPAGTGLNISELWEIFMSIHYDRDSPNSISSTKR
eukprot:COSAG05_NODE_397_length_10301_cov_65.155852_2_plen_67_part_00